MKKLLMVAALGGAFAAQMLPAFADATSAQKQQIEQARQAVRSALKTEEGCRAMCLEIINNKKSNMMICEMMEKTPPEKKAE